MRHKKRAEMSYEYVCKRRAVHLPAWHEGAASRLDASPGERGWEVEGLGSPKEGGSGDPPGTLPIPSTEGKGNRAQNTQAIVKGSLLRGNESQSARQQC